MAKYHPDNQLLNEYAAGSLPLAQSLCVSLHLNYCEQCRRNHGRLQQMASSMFEKLPPQPVDEGALDSIMARLDDAPPLSFSGPAVTADDSYPALVQRLMAGSYDELDWKRVTPDLKISRLRTGDGDSEVSLYHIRAGGSIPRHTHRGNEMTLVLDGAFSDEKGTYLTGDFILRDGEDVHTPTATRSGDCICLAVLDAPIKFKSWQYRPLNPFMTLNAG